MRNGTIGLLTLLTLLLLAACGSGAGGDGRGLLQPANGAIRLPLAGLADGKAHFYRVAADDGTVVSFFAIKSSDGQYRTAVDACDVCYKEGKGYHQEGDYMVCDNCGQKFASVRINEVKGGCNPAPLARSIEGDQLVIQSKEINANAWYMKFRKS